MIFLFQTAGNIYFNTTAYIFILWESKAAYAVAFEVQIPTSAKNGRTGKNARSLLEMGMFMLLSTPAACWQKMSLMPPLAACADFPRPPFGHQLGPALQHYCHHRTAQKQLWP